MTSSPSHGHVLSDLLARSRYVLLDFDGPVCDIFAGLPAPAVAERLRKVITGQAVELPTQVASTLDPIEVFVFSATVSPDLAARVEAEMADQEV